jgi:hypothetical protein
MNQKSRLQNPAGSPAKRRKNEQLKKQKILLCVRMGSGNAGFRKHLQGLDEALASLHGRLVDGGGPHPRDPAPATARRSEGKRGNAGGAPRPGGGRASGEGGTARSEEGKSSKRSTGESGVKGKGCLANRRQLSAAYSTAHHHRSLLDSILARARIPCGRWCAEEEEGPCLCWRWSAEEDGSGAGRATAAVG